MKSQAATRYSDFTFAKDGFSLSDGTNTFTAVAQDALGRGDTNAISVYLPASVAFTYDDNGNLTSDGRRGFEYDDENQLIRVTVTNAWKSEFVYDGRMRRRVRKEFVWQNSAWAQTSEVRYVYDGMLVIQERDGNNVPRVAYTRGLDLGSSLEGAGGIGGLLARTDHSVITPQHAYYHADGNGNVTALVNDKQVLVAKYLYDPFGNILAKSGPLAEANTYRFSSKEVHENAGLYYYGYRFYDPNLQRWLNRDPKDEVGHLLTQSSEQAGTLDRPPGFQQGLNLFGFVDNNPVGAIDPTGRNPLLIAAGILGFGFLCDLIIIRQMNRAKKELDNNTCVVWMPRCLNLIMLITAAPGPVGVQFCKDCYGNFNASFLPAPVIIGSGRGGA